MGQIHYQEDELDRYVRGLLEKTTADEINNHLPACKRCDAIVTFLREFNSNLEREFSHQVDTKIEDFINAKIYPRIIPLKVFTPVVDYSALNRQNNVIVLAAQTATVDTHRFRTVVTFVSEPHKIIARVVEDRTTGKFNIHILSEQTGFEKNLDIQLIEENGKIHSLKTDEKGIALFGPDHPIIWDEIKLLIVSHQNG